VEDSSEVAESRVTLLDVIGADRELTLVRGFDNHVFREIELDDLPGSAGDTVLLPGSGAFCRPYHEWMPRALAIAELRFERVIVLPSSFDVSEDAVRDSLRRTRAIVFAREAESCRQIESLCQAHLGVDCAFFFDFSEWQAAGEGTLNAFRTDREASGGELLLADNRDISLTAASLEAWLSEIGRHALVRTDRAHVMIAAALMGKDVEFAPGSYHKVEAIAAGSLRGLPVRPIESPRRYPSAAPASAPAGATRDRLRAAALRRPPGTQISTEPARVTAVVLTRNRPDLVAEAVRSVMASTVPVKVLLIDNNSDPENRPALVALAAADARIDLRLSDRNLGCAGGRRLATELVDTELALFLDDDAELIEGALEHMLADLDAHPAAAGVTALVVDLYGNVHHYGGWIAVSDETARFGLDGSGQPFDHPSLCRTGPSGWAPGTAALLRTHMLRDVELDDRMAAYYEDNEWCYRVEQRCPGSFRRCREAIVLHHHDPAAGAESSIRVVERFETFERLAAQAHFFRVSGVLLDVDLDRILPELRRPEGDMDLLAVRLLMEIILARGVAWCVVEWMNGGLRPLLYGGFERQAQVLAQARGRIMELEHEHLGAQEQIRRLMHEQSEAREQIRWLTDRHTTLCRVEAGGWWRLRSRLRPVLRVASMLRRLVG
jgi:GT2 family glycosyltransferase